MKNENKENTLKMDSSNPFLFRYSPNCRFLFGAFKTQSMVPVRKDDFGESITDKEAYRLALASSRGSIASGGTSRTGVYMFENGVYDESKDFSYIMRKDLTIVELDSYIKQKTEELKNADGDLAKQIEKELSELQYAKENLKDDESKENKDNISAE